MVFDEEGTPQIRVEMDSATHIMAMETFLQRWLAIIDESQRLAMTSEALYEEETEEKPDDEDEE